MAAAAARNLRDPRAAAAAAPGIPPSLDNPKHKHDLLLRLLPAPDSGPPPRRRRPNSSHTKGRRLALTPPSAEILNRGAGRGAGGSAGHAGGGRRRRAGEGAALAGAPGLCMTAAGEGASGVPGSEAKGAHRGGAGGPLGPRGPRRGGRARTLPLPRAE